MIIWTGIEKDIPGKLTKSSRMKFQMNQKKNHCRILCPKITMKIINSRREIKARNCENGKDYIKNHLNLGKLYMKINILDNIIIEINK